MPNAFSSTKSNKFCMDTRPMPAVPPKIIDSAGAHTQCLHFCQKQCRRLNAASRFALAIDAGSGLVPDDPVWPSARPQRDTMPWASLPPQPSAALSRTPTAHTWCLVAATWQSLGPEPSIAARRHGWGYPGWGTTRSEWKKKCLMVRHVTWERKGAMSLHGQEA